MKFLGLVFALAAGSWLASLAPELPDPVPAMSKALEQSHRRPFETPGPTMWFVDPVQPNPDFLFIRGVGYTPLMSEC